MPHKDPLKRKEYRRNRARTDKVKHEQHQRYLKNRDSRLQKAREQRYRQDFGITVAEYETMLNNQGGVCALCRRPPKTIRLSVDHNHTTGRIRGILCNNCNRFRVAKNTLETAQQVVDYLRDRDAAV